MPIFTLILQKPASGFHFLILRLLQDQPELLWGNGKKKGKKKRKRKKKVHTNPMGGRLVNS